MFDDTCGEMFDGTSASAKRAARASTVRAQDAVVVLDLMVACRPATVAAVRHLVDEALVAVGVSESCRADVAVAVSEACGDAVRHGATSTVRPSRPGRPPTAAVAWRSSPLWARDRART